MLEEDLNHLHHVVSARYVKGSSEVVIRCNWIGARFQE